METICDPNSHSSSKGGHGSKRVAWGGKDFDSVEEGGSDEDLCQVSGGPGVKAFAKVRESADFRPGAICQGKSLGEVLVCGVVILKPETKPFNGFGRVYDFAIKRDGGGAVRGSVLRGAPMDEVRFVN